MTVNVPLMQEVLKAIEETDGHWQQCEWRVLDFVTERITDLTPSTQGLHGLTELDYTCGTAMCCAGWAVHLEPSLTYLITPQIAIEARALFMEVGDFDDLVIAAPETGIVALGYCFSQTWRAYWQTELGMGSAMANLIQRHHPTLTDEHVIVSIEAAAASILGIEADPLALFEAGNTLADVKRIIGLYCAHPDDIYAIVEDQYDFELI